MSKSTRQSPKGESLNGEADPGDFPFGANATEEVNRLTNNTPDPFDVERLRLPVDDLDLGVEELLVTVPYQKPSKETFFRVHPDPDYRCKGGLIELKEDDGEAFWVDRAFWPFLADEPTFGWREVFTCVTRGGKLFLWGCRLPGPDGKRPDWVTIPLEAAKVAEEKWVKLYWDQTQRRHRIKVATSITDSPKWPDKPLPELLRLAFADRVITEPHHPILKKLRGEV